MTKSNSILCFVFSLWLFANCQNKGETTSIPYPSTFAKDHFQINNWNYFVLNASGQTAIPAQGNFLQYESLANAEIPSTLSYFPIDSIELINESTIRILAVEGGFSIDTTLSCTTEGNFVTVNFDGIPPQYYKYKYDPSTNSLSLSVACFLYTFKLNGVPMDYSTIGFEVCKYGQPAAEWVSEKRDQIFLLQAGDTLVVNFLDLIYK